MIYLLLSLGFVGMFFTFSVCFHAYIKEVGKAEAHVGFKIPPAISGLLKTTFIFSVLSTSFAFFYVVYSALLESGLL